jgi:hypothetical protein
MCLSMYMSVHVPICMYSYIHTYSSLYPSIHTYTCLIHMYPYIHTCNTYSTHIGGSSPITHETAINTHPLTELAREGWMEVLRVGVGLKKGTSRQAPAAKSTKDLRSSKEKRSNQVISNHLKH